MSEQRERDARSGTNTNRKGESGQVAKTDRRNIILTRLDTKNVVDKLNGLFEAVVSGGDYDDGQVRSAASLTNSMVKVLRFEFDVYKHFSGRQYGARQDAMEIDSSADAGGGGTVAQVAEFLRSTGDEIKKGKSPNDWIINGRHCTEDDLLRRANNLRTAEGLPVFEIG